jgi:N-acyl-D-aspartate/D-glutamate deacylase
MVHDLIIRGGTVFDGTGAKAFEADVAVSDGRIAAVGKLAASARDEIDARGQMVTPGSSISIRIMTGRPCGTVTWRLLLGTA